MELKLVKDRSPYLKSQSFDQNFGFPLISRTFFIKKVDHFDPPYSTKPAPVSHPCSVKPALHHRK